MSWILEHFKLPDYNWTIRYKEYRIKKLRIRIGNNDFFKTSKRANKLFYWHNKFIQIAIRNRAIALNWRE